MKNKDQIEMALEIVRELQDYVELAKTEKRLKLKENAEVVSNQIETVAEVAKKQIINL